jgi:hypothetical protein
MQALKDINLSECVPNIGCYFMRILISSAAKLSFKTAIVYNLTDIVVCKLFQEYANELIPIEGNRFIASRVVGCISAVTITYLLVGPISIIAASVLCINVFTTAYTLINVMDQLGKGEPIGAYLY